MEKNTNDSSLEKKKIELNELRQKLQQEELEILQKEIDPLKVSIDGILGEEYKCGCIIDYKGLSDMLVKMFEGGAGRIFIPYQIYKK